MRSPCLITGAVICASILGCTSCGREPGPDSGDHDATADADTEREPAMDADQDEVINRDAETDVEVDEDALPPPVPMELVEVTRDREGLDCGPGCQQLSFAEPPVLSEYDVSDEYVVYRSANEPWSVFVINTENATEAVLREDAPGTYQNLIPAIYETTIVFPTRRLDIDSLRSTYIFWKYRLGDSEKTSLVQRRMTESARPPDGSDINLNLMTWMDSAIPPDGIYAMNLDNSDVIALTPEPCLCYGEPQLEGRQVVYQGWPTGDRDIWLVDVDSLEREDLNDSPAPQFDPAFDGQWVVWADGRNDPGFDPWWDRTNPDIYGMELATRAEEPLCDHPAAQLYPDVRDGLVVWEDFRNAANPNDGRDTDANTDIYLLELETGLVVQVTSLPGPERRPRVWGRRVFFVAEDLIGQDAVFMVDLVEAGLLEPASQ